jgi:nucleoside-diphosphate-sugar epimerase
MQTFLVTGASGYIASWIVTYLLEQNHNVHATVRSLQDSLKTTYLQELLKKYPEKLKLFEADLLDRESFRKPMVGCDVVLHTASPFFIAKVKDAHRDLIRPALEGTRNVLTMASEFPAIRRIVVTSSVAAVYSDATDIRATKDGQFDETIWNTGSDEKHNPYQYSKTLAEKEAWKIATNQTQWDLITINPGFVMGPSLSKRTDSTSIDTMRSLISGKFRTGVPDLWFGVVDVRDVARAHILAATKPEASGRYICVGHSVPLLDMALILRGKFPGRPIPKSLVPKFMLYLAGPVMGFSWKFIRSNYGIPYRFNTRKSLSLGLQYTPLSDTLSDHAAQLINDHLI